MKEKELQKLFQDTLKVSRRFHDLDSKFTKSVEEFYNLSDEQKERLFDNDGIVDPMQYATGKITWREFKRYVKEVKLKCQLKY